MNKRAITLIIIVLILGAIVGIVFMKNPAKAPSGSSTTSSNSTTQNQQNTQTETKPTATNAVEIKDFAFTPATITVKKGTTVTWTNKDSTQHSIAPDSESADFKPSDLLAQGQTYSATFNTVGTFTYHCSLHPSMKASVIVTE